MNKDKYLQIFKYLLEFSKLRMKPVRDIENSSNYTDIIWISEIPSHNKIDCIIHESYSKESDYWLKISKPVEPIAPKEPLFPNETMEWIDPDSWKKEDDVPSLLHSKSDADGIIKSLNDYPKIKESWDKYIDNNWEHDKGEYWQRMKTFENEYSLFLKANLLYKKLFSIYNKSEQFGEEYEFICGVGLINFKENDETPLICRHVITAKAEIQFEFSKSDSSIIVSPNIQNELSLETDAIIDLFEQFEANDIVEGEKKAKEIILEKELVNPFSGDIHEVLQLFAERIKPGEGQYIEQIEKESKLITKETIYYAPAFILRKRNTRSFTSTYQKIIDDIENTEDPTIPTLDDIVDLKETGATSEELDSSSNNKKIDNIYFPKKYNEEQVSILSRAKFNNKVLVQGPPGTGKSHTIANLICHLLANGKKVLVTAYTKRALEVLKDKLPKEFQNLTVNLLSGDSSSIKDLEASVNNINDKIANSDIPTRKKRIEDFEQKLIDLRSKRSYDKNELFKIKEKSSRKIEINSEYTGTLTEIAASLESEKSKFSWYQDDFYDVNNIDKVEQLESYLKLHDFYSKEDCSIYKMQLPTFSKLVRTNVLEKYQRHLKGSRSELKEMESINCSDFSELNRLLSEIEIIYNNVKRIQNPIVNTILEDILDNKHRVWQSIYGKTEALISELANYNLRNLDRNVEINYPKDISLLKLKADAKILLDYINDGHSLNNVNFKLKKAFLPKEIKERLYFIETVSVNGSPCDTKNEFITILDDIRIRQNFEELSGLWSDIREVPESLNEKHEFFNQLNKDLKETLKNGDLLNSLTGQIKEISNLKIELPEIESLSEVIEYIKQQENITQITEIEEEINQVISYLSSNNFHPISKEICLAIQSADTEKYKSVTRKLTELQSEFEEYEKYKDLDNNVKDIFPKTLKIINSEEIPENIIPDLRKAIIHKSATNEVAKLLSSNFESKLIEKIKSYDSTEEKIVAQLASEKSWTYVIEDLRRNSSLRRHLEAWVQAVKKIGKTGRGKRALKFRKVAQQEMEHCKTTVPCWIMPLYKVTETIQPEKDMYDYVIVDEASQLGPDALFLLYISKNIIIVGDDKQTSPEYVGVNADIMSPYINKHLQGIPFKNFYGTEHSFFDHAKIFCDGMIVLREHFRCMPEIIEFSNRQFYAPDGKGLYPLKQYSENRLDPLKAVYCQNGYVDGKGSTIINKPEANEIVLKIKELIQDERYDGKTFGVISLQGKVQGPFIESQLLKEIGEKEFKDRKIICGNSASFQGDERDIIFLSMITAENHNRSALTRAEDERRFNVAASRAIEQMWLFHSVLIDDLSNVNDLRYKILDHFSNFKPIPPPPPNPIQRTIGNQPSPFDSWFEVDVFNDIVTKGYSVIPQYEVARGRYRIDLVAFLNDGTKIAIECDGDKWHGAEQYSNDLARQKVLERCGWQFFRIRGGEYYSNRQKVLEPLWTIFNEHNITAKKDIIGNDKKWVSDKSIETDSVLKNQPADLNSDTNNNFIVKNIEIVRYFNLNQSGLYTMTEGQPEEADYNIPIMSNQKNGFLLQCYSSGHINKVFVSTLLSKRIGKEYMNGLNSNDELIHLEIIEEDSIVGIFFTDNDGEKFKAHLSENISNREQLQLQGYKVMYNNFNRINYIIIPISKLKDLNRLVFQSFTSSGKLITNKYYDKEWELLEEYKNLNMDKEVKKIGSHIGDKILQNSINDQKLKLNSKVRIRYVKEDKIVDVQFVNKIIKGIEKNNDIQLISNNSPLGNSLIGRDIGEKVRIGNTEIFVEILEFLN